MKSNRGRKPGNTEVIWHTKLKEILEQSLKKKPRYIDEEFIKSYCGKFPSDLPTKKNRDPRDSKIKQVVQRFKRNIELKVQKDDFM